MCTPSHAAVLTTAAQLLALAAEQRANSETEPALTDCDKKKPVRGRVCMAAARNTPCVPIFSRNQWQRRQRTTPQRSLARTHTRSTPRCGCCCVRGRMKTEFSRAFEKGCNFVKKVATCEPWQRSFKKVGNSTTKSRPAVEDTGRGGPASGGATQGWRGVAWWVSVVRRGVRVMRPSKEPLRAMFED
jgi:hypothetical protein